MRTRIFFHIVILVLVLSCIELSYGIEVNENDSNIKPLYEETERFSVSFDIFSSGMAEINGVYVPKKETKVDKVYALLKITNTTTEKETFSKRIDMPYSQMQNRYTLHKNIQLYERGNYRLDLTYQSYDSDMLLETINMKPKLRKYN